MKKASQDGVSWTRGRLLAVAGVLFALQAGLILLFGDRSRPVPPPPALSTQVRWLGASVGEPQLLQWLFVGDPAVFPLPGPHGFSGRAWLSQRPPAYQSQVQLEPPSWLNLDPARLGTDFPAPALGFPAISSDLAEQQSLRVEPPPVFLPPEMVPTQSVFRLEGELAGSLLGQPPQLSTQTNLLLLRNSVVQIAVDPAGAVLAARLDSRCGSAEADADAVAAARELRFAPSSAGRTRWGQAVFQWQTTEPPAAPQSKTP
jgi:hypothetical protein